MRLPPPAQLSSTAALLAPAPPSPPVAASPTARRSRHGARRPHRRTCSSDRPATPARRARGSLDAVVGAGSPGVIALRQRRPPHRAPRRGRRRSAQQARVRPDDRFRAGSITKSFVATVALQLVGERKLSLSDTVEHWLPGILPYGDKVNVRPLLNLTSGVPDNQLPVNIEIYRGDKLHAWTPRELVELVADKPQEFPAGTGWAYSNTNYALAGMIDRARRRATASAMTSAGSSSPLRLRDTSFPVDEPRSGRRCARLLARLRRLLRADRGQAARRHLHHPSGTWAAGNLVSSAADIAHFWRAAARRQAARARPADRDEAHVPAWKGLPYRYGLGLMESPPTAAAARQRRRHPRVQERLSEQRGRHPPGRDDRQRQRPPRGRRRGPQRRPGARALSTALAGDACG